MTRRDLMRLLLASAVAEAVDVERLLWVPKPMVTVPTNPFDREEFDTSSALPHTEWSGNTFHVFAPLFVSQGGTIQSIMAREFEHVGPRTFVQRGWAERWRKGQANPWLISTGP